MIDMGEMADYFLDLDERYERDDDESEGDDRPMHTRYMSKKEKQERTMEQYSDPVMWTRANGNEIHIKDMSQHHLRNALAHLEKALEGQEEMPAIYYNMLARAKAVGLGITDAQIDKLITHATKPKPFEFSTYDPATDYGRYPGTILGLVEADDEVDLVVLDENGESEYVVLSLKKDGKMHLYPLPKRSKFTKGEGQLPILFLHTEQ